MLGASKGAAYAPCRFKMFPILFSKGFTMSTDLKTTYLYAFEDSCRRLIAGTATGIDFDKLTAWYRANPHFQESMWTIAHFTYDPNANPMREAIRFFDTTVWGSKL